MILSDLLVALSNNMDVNITLMDDSDNKLITFNASGYGAVESDLGNRKVKRIKIEPALSVVIAIEDPENDPTGDP